MNKTRDILIMATIFVSSYVFFKQPFEGYVSYLIYALYFPLFISRFGVPRQVLALFAPLLISGLIYVWSGFNTSGQFLKVFIGFFASVMFYNLVIQFYKFDLKRLFKLYMKGAYYCSLIGIFQLVSFLVGFGPGYNYSWIFNKWAVTPGGLGIRMNSIFSEPAYFAAVIAPAFLVATYALIKRRKVLFLKRSQLIVIFIAFFLTFSTLGFIGMLVVLMLLLINLGFLRYAIVIGPVIFFGYQYAYENIDEFRDRMDGTQEVFGNQNIRNYRVHGSSFVLYNNYWVAKENFKAHPFFGTGLGSHPTAFDKYSLTNQFDVIQIEFNKMDANSMALRLMSETGLYGMIIMGIILVRFFVYKPRAKDEELWLISTGCLIIILLYLMRQGHYFLNGLPFFIWMYVYAKRQALEGVPDEKAVGTESDDDSSSKIKFIPTAD